MSVARSFVLLLVLLLLGGQLLAVAQPAPPAQPSLRQLRQRLATAPTDTARFGLLMRLADAYLYSHFDSAWAYTQQARALAQQLGYADGLYRTSEQLGILYGMRGSHEASLRLFLEQLRLSQQRPDSARRRPAILSNIANSYYSQGKYAAATALLTAVYRADLRAHDTTGQLSDLNNLTQLLIKQHQLPQALRTGQAAVRLTRRYRAGAKAAQSYLFLVNVLVEQGRYAAARDTCLRVLPAVRRAGDGQQLTYAYQLLLRAYHPLGELAAAEQAGQQALAYAQAAGMLDVQAEVLGGLAAVAAEARDPALAYRRQLAAAELTARLTRESNAKTVEDMQFKYDTDQKDQQVQGLAQRVRASRWQAGLGVGLALVALLAVGLLYRAKQLQTQLFAQRQQLEATTRRQLELELAGSQRELASGALFAQQKTQLLEDLTARLETLLRRVPEAHRERVAEMKTAIRRHLHVGEEWEQVTRHFEKIHPEFFECLRQRCPALTPGELKQCAYVKLNLSNKEIAGLLNIAATSVKVSHYRIKKKLDLAEDEALRDYIVSI